MIARDALLLLDPSASGAPGCRTTPARIRRERILLADTAVCPGQQPGNPLLVGENHAMSGLPAPPNVFLIAERSDAIFAPFGARQMEIAFVACAPHNEERKGMASPAKDGDPSISWEDHGNGRIRFSRGRDEKEATSSCVRRPRRLERFCLTGSGRNRRHLLDHEKTGRNWRFPNTSKRRGMQDIQSGIRLPPGTSLWLGHSMPLSIKRLVIARKIVPGQRPNTPHICVERAFSCLDRVWLPGGAGEWAEGLPGAAGSACAIRTPRAGGAALVGLGPKA